MKNKPFKLYLSVCLCLLCLQLCFAEPSTQTKNEFLTLELATQRAMIANPDIHAAQANEEAIKYLGKKESLTPEPHLSIGLDEFAGNGNFSGTSALKTSFGISQTITTGNKTSLRKKLARASNNAAGHETANSIRLIKFATCKAFLEIIYAEQMLDIASEALAIARENSRIVSRRVSAGEIPPIDATRTRVDFSAAELQLKKEQRNLQASRLKMATILNDSKFSYEKTRINFEPFIEFAEKIETDGAAEFNHPEIDTATAYVSAAKTEIELARAQRSPDLNLSGKMNRFRATGEHAYSLELEIELPFGRRIRTARKMAAARLKEAKANRDAVAIRINNELQILRQTIGSLKADYLHTLNVLLPAAQQAYAETSMAFSAGEKNLTDLFDARKTLLEIREISCSIENELYQKVLEYSISGNFEDPLIARASQVKEK